MRWWSAVRGTGKGGGRAQPLGLSVLGEDAIATLSILNEISNGVMLVTMATTRMGPVVLCDSMPKRMAKGVLQLAIISSA